MATDAVVVTASDIVQIETMAMTPIVQLAPMQPGRSYLVWASGVLHIKNALITIELDAFHETDTITLFGPEYGTHHSFALAVGRPFHPTKTCLRSRRSRPRSRMFWWTPSQLKSPRRPLGSLCSQWTASRYLASARCRGCEHVVATLVRRSSRTGHPSDAKNHETRTTGQPPSGPSTNLAACLQTSSTAARTQSCSGSSSSSGTRSTKTHEESAGAFLVCSAPS